MDGAIPAFSADSMRRLTASFNLSSGTSSAHSLQSGLFEQLLSAPPPSRMERQSFSPTASHANSSIDSWPEHDRDSGTSNATHRSDGDERRDVQPDDEDQSEPLAVAAQATALPAAPAAAPLPVDEATADNISEGAAAGEAADSDLSEVHMSKSALGELPAESPNILSDQAKRLSQDAVEDGELQANPLERSTQVQAGARDDTPSGSSADTPSGESQTQVQSAQVSALPATEDAAENAVEHAVALDPSRNAAQEELSPLELGDERLAEPRPQAADMESAVAAEESATATKESAVATGNRSQESGQAEVASTGGGKSRDNRREKWFQRDADDSSSTRSESNTASRTPAAQTGTSADRLSAGVAGAPSGAMPTALDEGGGNGSPAAESTAAQTLPDSLLRVQPPTVNTLATPLDRRLSALENAAGGGPGGERQLAQGNAVDGIETSQRQSSAQRVDAKPGAQDAQRPDVLTQAERVRLVQRVSRSFARLGPMGGQISLKLHPPQLGALNVQVRMEGRSMAAKLTTENGAARDAILESLPVLRKRLAEQGFEISSFQVEVADNQSDVASGSDNSRAGYDLSGGRDDRQAAGQATDYRRLAAQQRQPSDRYDVSPNSAAVSSGAAWELPRGVDVEA